MTFKELLLNEGKRGRLPLPKVKSVVPEVIETYMKRFAKQTKFKRVVNDVEKFIMVTETSNGYIEDFDDDRKQIIVTITRYYEYKTLDSIQNEEINIAVRVDGVEIDGKVTITDFKVENLKTAVTQLIKDAYKKRD